MSVTGQWMMCLCTWFVEDTDTLKAEHEMREEEAKRDAKRRKLGKYDVT